MLYPKFFGYPTYVGDEDIEEEEDKCKLEQRIRKKKDKIINSMTEEQLADYTELLRLEHQLFMMLHMYPKPSERG